MGDLDLVVPVNTSIANLLTIEAVGTASLTSELAGTPVLTVANGGDLTLRDLTVQANTSGGRALVVTVGSLALDGVSVVGSPVTGGTGGGGCILATDAALSVVGSVVQGCLSNGDGGAIRATNTTLFMVSSEINSCSAANGGAIAIAGTGTLALAGSVLSSNVAASDGSGGHLLTSVPTTLLGSTLSGGLAAYGGAVYASGALSVDRTSIEGATATKDGGAIYLSPASSIEVHDSVFLGNSAAQGAPGLGGGAILANDAASVEVVRTLFCGNNTDANGGAIHLEGSGTGGTHHIVNSVFHGNAAQKGGGVYAREPDTTIVRDSWFADVASAGGSALSVDVASNVLASTNAYLAHGTQFTLVAAALGTGSSSSDLFMPNVSQANFTLTNPTTGFFAPPVVTSCDFVDAGWDALSDVVGPFRTGAPDGWPDTDTDGLVCLIDADEDCPEDADTDTDADTDSDSDTDADAD
ncbi:MAG: hypothetical protein H6734_22600, partial [Alphaproteobacteria bacterium]|nr:hypothetical protein [Alphaproteobacteria bacterium]